MSDLLIHYGDAVKALDDKGRVGGYLVRFGSPSEKDTAGEYFTADTYLGPSDGDGAEALFHHSQPVLKGLEHLASRTFRPLKTRRDDIGIWAETVLNMADEYEAKVYELVQAGKLGWSSGSAPHRVKKLADGQITSWPICEGSLTPEPAEPRNKGGILPLKSLLPTEGMAMTKADDTAREEPKEEAKADSTTEPTPETKQDPEPQEAPREEPAAKADTAPAGHALLSDVHARLSAVMADCEKAYAGMEPGADVCKTIEEVHGALQDVKDLIAERAAEHYPEHEVKDADGDGDRDENAGPATASKSDEDYDAEYKKLTPAERAWVDRELADIARMQKQLDARQAMKANHNRRLRDAAALRGAR